MSLPLIVLLLLVCLLISNIISHYIPTIPTALVQIGFGILVALFVQDITIHIETEWFLLLFVAPLLYNDGRHFPREELWKMRGSIMGNAIILVLLTTVIGGYFIHYLIPAIPLAASFALAAILSPTDPVAVNGIAKRIHIPDKVLNLVRGESLINDASGLVAFNYAIAAVVTGYFSLNEALIDFSYMFVAGALLGLILGFLFIGIKFSLRKKGIGDVTFYSLLQILTPFVIYIITEDLLHASGVIAVVVAGILQALVKEQTATIHAEEQVVTENLWSVLLFVLNGIVFILLGLNIPSSMMASIADPSINNWLLIGYVIAIGIVILVIRFVWSYCFSYYEFSIKKKKEAIKPSLKQNLFISLTGVRGAVTMAGVLSIPFVVMTGEEFPERSLILFIAAGVILFTLLIATFCLPLLSKNEKKSEQQNELEFNNAKQRILLTAIKQIEKEKNEDNYIIAEELITEYKRMFHSTHFEEQNRTTIANYQKKIIEVRLLALKAERKYINQLFNQGKMREATYIRFEKIYDHREEAFSTNFGSKVNFLFGRMFRAGHQLLFQFRKNQEETLTRIRFTKDIQLKACQAALEALEEYATKCENKDVILAVMSDYRHIIHRMQSPAIMNTAKREELKEELRLSVMEVERGEIQKMYAEGDINREQAKELRRLINYMESVTLQEHVE